MFGLFGLFNNNFEPHSYSFCYMNGKRVVVNRVFSTRAEANRKMYDICNKRGFKIIKVYDDKHEKAYYTDNGAEFHINRIF